MSEKKIKRRRPSGASLTEEEIEKRRRARKRREMKKRRRRRRIILTVFVVAIIALLVIIGRGVAGKISESMFEKATESTLTLKPDGTVIFEEVSELGEEYDASKLSAFAKAQIKAFDVDENSYVKLEDVAVEGNTAYIRTRYSDTNVYSRFTGYEVYYGTVKGAKSAGYDFSTTFNKVKTSAGSDGEMKAITSGVNRSEVMSADSKNILVLRENVRIVVFGDIEYVSSENTEVGVGYVKSKSVGGNEDAAALTYVIFNGDTEEK